MTKHSKSVSGALKRCEMTPSRGTDSSWNRKRRLGSGALLHSPSEPRPAKIPPPTHKDCPVSGGRLSSSSSAPRPAETPAPASGKNAVVGRLLPPYSSFSAPCPARTPSPTDNKYPVFDDRKSGRDEDDPNYRMFLDHLRVDGNSYLYEMAVGGSDPPLRVKYEGGEGFDVAAPWRQPKSRHSSGSKRTGSGEANGRSTPESNKRRKRMTLDQNLCKFLHPRTPVSSSRVHTGGSLIDEDYLVFLNNVKVHDGLILRNNETIVYENIKKEEKEVEEQEEEKEMVTEIEKIAEENEVYPVEMEEEPSGVPLQPSGSSGAEDHSFLAEILRRKPSSFRNRLVNVLREPFDKKEYEGMMSHISIRKPIVNYKHLRDDSIPYATSQLGLSYLDHYPDLAKCIESASDDHHKNFLLRGFFFWLQNVGSSDSFRPWIPAIPESRYVAIDSGDGKIMEKKMKEGKEVYEQMEGVCNVNLLLEEGKRVGEEVKEEAMPTETTLCGKEKDVCSTKIEIKPDGHALVRWSRPDCDDLQPFNLLVSAVTPTEMTLWKRKGLTPTETTLCAKKQMYRVCSSEMDIKPDCDPLEPFSLLVSAVMPTETTLCGKEKDVYSSEMQTRPGCNDLQPSNLLVSKNVGYSVKRVNLGVMS
ncbi:hypothetical protein Cni_G14979 [Canna indica]|uniref:Uncharacterized protein n=1 Tax=Canna indica TaxID=4628 RepID=A0AAQ3KG18_9LILI|nr:hypothetical protein Cni_G14979 [Canna indica]